MGVLLLSVVGVAIPVVSAGEGIADILASILEALVEGAVLVIEGIASVISGIFG